MAGRVDSDDETLARNLGFSRFPVSRTSLLGMTAALEASSGADLLHTPEEEREMLHAMKRAGGVDGTTRTPALSVDGFGMDDQVALVRELRALTRGPRG